MLRLLATLVLAVALMASTRVPKYANDLGWTLLPGGPSSISIGGAPSAVNVVMAGGSAWAASGVYNTANPAASTSTIIRFDPYTLAVQATIPVAGWLHGLAGSPGKLWATDLYGNRVYRIDIATNKVDATVPGVTSPGGLVYGAGKMLVSNRTLGAVSFIDADTASLLGPPVPTGPSPFWPDYNGKHFRVPNFGGNSVSKLDPVSMAVLSTVAAGSQPFAILSDGSQSYVSNYGGAARASISVLDDAKNGTDAVVATWQVGDAPPSNTAGLHFMAIYEGKLFVTASNLNLVYVLDRLGGGKVLDTIPTGPDPAALCLTGPDLLQLDYGAGVLNRINLTHAVPN